MAVVSGSPDVRAVNEAYLGLLSSLDALGSQMEAASRQVSDVQADVNAHYQSDQAAPIFNAKIGEWQNLYTRYRGRVQAFQDGTVRAKNFIDQHADLAAQVAQGVPIGQLMPG